MSNKAEPATDEQIAEWRQCMVGLHVGCRPPVNALLARIEFEKARADRATEDAQSLTEQVATLFERIGDIQKQLRAAHSRLEDRVDNDTAKRITELEARLKIPCKGCPGCATGDCPDAIDRLADAEALIMRIVVAKATSRHDCLQAAHTDAEVFLAKRGK